MIDEKLTMRIKTLREDAGLTQKQLAEKMGVVQSNIANWESGLSLPRSQDLPALARALKCKHIDELYPEEARP